MTERLFSRTGRVAAFVVGALLLASGCSKEATPSAEQPKASPNQPADITPAAVAKTGEPAPERGEDSTGEGDGVALGAGAASYKESNFALSIAKRGEYKAGQEGKVEITLEAKAPFKANDKYPYKFKTAESAGVTFPAPIVKKDAATVEHMKVTMPVAFTAEAGKKQIKGVFHFSVCTEDKCLIEKRALALEIDVK
jgi:hypothetical protein